MPICQSVSGLIGVSIKIVILIFLPLSLKKIDDTPTWECGDDGYALPDEVEDDRKATPLSVAMHIGNEEIIDFLKNNGAVCRPQNMPIPLTFSFGE